MVGFDKFHDLLNQDVTPKNLLRYVAIAVIALVGISGILQNLGAISNFHTQTTSHDRNYGVSVYER